MQIVDFFGPRIAKSSLNVELTKELHEICLKSKTTFNHKLVGYIREENSITNELRDSKVLQTITDHVNRYLIEIDSGAWKPILKLSDSKNLLEMSEAWYNKQVANEYNPLHDHRHTADLVCVIFTKIELDASFNNYYSTNHSTKQQGELTFYYSYNDKNDFGKRQITIQPKAGDFYIFPSTLGHFTDPVFGNSERYSVSCNFNFNTYAKNAIDEYLHSLKQF